MNLEVKFNWRGRLIRYAPLILWTCVVLFNSTNNASSAQTSRFIGPLLHFLFPHASEETLAVYHIFVRKCAHFIEYGTLGFFAARAFYESSINLLKKYPFIFAFLFVALTASIDEYNQSFNPARTSSIDDVLLDCAGGLTVIALFYCWRLRFKSSARRISSGIRTASGKVRQ